MKSQVPSPELTGGSITARGNTAKDKITPAPRCIWSPFQGAAVVIMMAIVMVSVVVTRVSSQKK